MNSRIHFYYSRYCSKYLSICHFLVNYFWFDHISRTYNLTNQKNMRLVKTNSGIVLYYLGVLDRIVNFLFANMEACSTCVTCVPGSTDVKCLQKCTSTTRRQARTGAGRLGMCTRRSVVLVTHVLRCAPNLLFFRSTVLVTYALPCTVWRCIIITASLVTDVPLHRGPKRRNPLTCLRQVVDKWCYRYRDPFWLVVGYLTFLT